MYDTPQVTAAEISRLAGVTRATVSNWRRRHPDFPSPSGGSEARPLFELADVRDWLRERGLAAAESPLRELRTVLRAAVRPQDIPGLIDQLPALAADPHPHDADDEVLRAIRAAAHAGDPVAVLDALAERGLEENPTTGVYPTPKPLADLIVELIRGVEASHGVGVPVSAAMPAEVLDPACGSGTLLRAAAHAGARELFGQDLLTVQAHRARALLALEAERTANSSEAPGKMLVSVAEGDSLAEDAFSGLTFDAVISNPPFQQRDWGADRLALDPRWEYGVPPRVESELAWVQHALSHLRPGGRAVLLLPPAVAMRSSGRRIRANLLRAGALRAVIGLPAGLAPPRQIALQLWVLMRPAPELPVPDDVLFLDTARLVADQAATPVADTLPWDDLTRLVTTTWRAFARGDREAATVEPAAVLRVMDVLDDDVDLTPARHVRAAVDADRTGEAVTAALRDLLTEIDEIRAAAAELEFLTTSDAPAWRTATVRDLAAGGALEVLNSGNRADPPEADLGTPALTGRDVATDSDPTGLVDDTWQRTVVRIERNDVIVPLVHGGRDRVVNARVAPEKWIGAAIGLNVIALRVDPDRLDPWFVAGFAGSPDTAASPLGSSIRLVPQRIRIPLLPLPRQREYGAAFARLHHLRAAARRTDDLAAHINRLVANGLTVGALEPATTAEGGK
ncbi:N-6 DNA methylase [Nocardia shimofusensis]|uniref:N-6 DNA methylase n=1 Tax=Nocardia shimofusensis TaxID=228596 RepID=UPI00082CBECC|nr:N-6 DNA methylase [Nocardia shimofusensis]